MNIILVSNNHYIRNSVWNFCIINESVKVIKCASINRINLKISITVA